MFDLKCRLSLTPKRAPSLVWNQSWQTVHMFARLQYSSCCLGNARWTFIDFKQSRKSARTNLVEIEEIPG